MQPRRDAELVMLARSGDKEAFGELIRCYEPMARRLAFGVVGQEDLVQEVTQEAFLAAYLSLDQLREPQRFKAWLYSIVLNEARSLLKERKLDPLSLEQLTGGRHRELHLVSDAVVDPQEVAEEQELHRLLLSAVQALPAKERVATLFFYYQQLSLEEIAAILGISIVAVKSRLFKARNHLREQLLPTSEGARPSLRHKERKPRMAKVRVYAVRKNLSTDERVVILWDEIGRRALYIWIPQREAQVIAMGLMGVSSRRPMTMYFLMNVLKATGVQLEEVRIEAYKDEIYYAIAKVRNGELVSEIDVRPSDAIGLAVLMDRPIFVAEDILEKNGIVVPEGKDLEQWRAEQWLEREGITLPEGKTVQIKRHDREQARANVLQAMEETLNQSRRRKALTAEERGQITQRYLALLTEEEV